MTTGWGPLQNALPQSVHDLMAMWGAFDAPRDADGCGMEKRLELDFCRPIAPGDVAVAGLERVMAHAGEAIGRRAAGGGLVALQFDRSVVVLSATRVIVTSAPSVPLHAALRPLLDLLRSHAVDVEWASFMRVNTHSPWTSCEMSDIMAEEYAELKSVFPSGHPYLAGPIDQDHFFYFVYDAIQRHLPDAPVENDVQINIYMYNVRAAEECEDDSETLKNTWQVVPLCETEFEMLRVCTDAMAHPFASFETNAVAAAKNPAAMVKSLLDRFLPDKFTMILLQDRRSLGDPGRAAFQEIDGYTVMNRAMNHFGEGYAFLQIVCTRAE